MVDSRPHLLPHRVMAWLAVVSLLTCVLGVACFGSGSVAADEPLDDVTPPVISDVAAVDITGTGARITWTTDEPATSQVEYGLLAPFYAVSLLAMRVDSEAERRYLSELASRLALPGETVERLNAVFGV